MSTKSGAPPGTAAAHAPAGRSMASMQFRQISTRFTPASLSAQPVSDSAPATGPEAGVSNVPSGAVLPVRVAAIELAGASGDDRLMAGSLMAIPVPDPWA